MLKAIRLVTTMIVLAFVFLIIIGSGFETIRHTLSGEVLTWSKRPQ